MLGINVTREVDLGARLISGLRRLISALPTALVIKSEQQQAPLRVVRLVLSILGLS